MFLEQVADPWDPGLWLPPQSLDGSTSARACAATTRFRQDDVTSSPDYEDAVAELNQLLTNRRVPPSKMSLSGVNRELTHRPKGAFRR